MSRPSRRHRGGAAIGFEQLEARRVMYGAGVLDFGEGEAGSTVAEFSLADVNPSSNSFNQSISPSDYLQQVSAWYFGHST